MVAVEVVPRLECAALLIRDLESGRSNAEGFPPPLMVATAFALVWQALEWAYGMRP